MSAISTASTANESVFSDQLASGVMAAMHPGDPIVLNSNNATATGNIEQLTGYYSDR